jgi:hypothetical protein
MIADDLIKSLKSIQFKRFIDQLRIIKKNWMQSDNKKSMWENQKKIN